MRRREFSAALLASALVVPLTSVEAQAAPSVRFTGVQYDSAGDDTGSNSSLNGEWFRIKNFSSTAKDLSGWKVRDVTGYTYTFPAGYKLGAGASVKVHTGKGSNGRTDRYWGKTWYVWNNTGDEAGLKTKAGTLVDRCQWDDGDGSTGC